MVNTDGDVAGFALAIFGFVLWTAALTLLLPRALAYGIAFLVNRALSRAHMSIGAIYCYPLAGRCVVHRIVYADSDAVVSVAELVVVWRWWRRGRLLAFDDAFDDSAASAISKDDDANCCGPWFCLWRPICAFLRSASPLQDDAPAALLSFVCAGLRVRLVSMKANYDLLERLRAYAAGDRNEPDPPAPKPLDPDQPRKTMVDHLLEYSSLKVTSGALYVCDPGNSPLLRVLFSSAKIRYRHGRPRSHLDLFRFTLSVRVTELHISVADMEMLRASGVTNPPEIEQSSQQTGDAVDNPCIPRFCSRINLGSCICGSSEPTGCFACSRTGRARVKKDLECMDLIHAGEAYIEYVCDEPGPDVADINLSEEPLPPELRCTVELQDASIVYMQKAISCLQDVQERLFPRLFDLTRVAEQFQGRLRRRIPHSFILEVIANSKGYNEDGSILGERIPLVTAPFTPRTNTWKLLDMLGIHRSKTQELDENGHLKLPESAISIFSEKVNVRTEIPYKMGDPLHVRADLPRMELHLDGVVSAPACYADGLNVAYNINFPKVWNHVHKSHLECTVLSGEFTYMADLIRMIDDLTFTIDAQNRKPEDIRYFVPNEFSISIKAEQGVSVRLAASRGNSWSDIYKGLTDEFGMAVLKAEEAELKLELNSGVEYLPSVVVVEWGLDLPNPSLFLALPCPRPSSDPLRTEEDENARGPSVLNEGHEQLTFAQRVRALVEMANNANDDSSTQKRETTTKNKRPRSISTGILEDEHVMIKIAEVGGSATIQGRGTAHTVLFADGVNENRVKVVLTGVALDVNPHHVQHYLNIIANLSAFMNHMVSAEEKHSIDLKRRALAFDLVQDGRVPSFEECVILGTEGGVSLATSAYHTQDRAPAPTAMDEATNISLEIDGGVLMLHNLPNALSSFTEHPNQVCSIEIGRVCFALTGNHKEVVSRFAPIPESAPFVVYAGQPRDLKSNVFRRAQNRPLKDHSLSKYPSVTLSGFLLTRQVLFNKNLGAYCSILDVQVGKVEGCFQETALLAIAGFVKGVSVHPPYDEAPVVEALVGLQTIQVRVGRTDVLILCGSQALTIEDAERRKPSRDSLPSSGHSSARKRARVFIGFLPSAVAGIVQLRLRDGMRFCMSNAASSDVLSRTAATVPDLSLQLFTPWGGSSTPWKDEATIRAQVSHSSAIKAWRQVGVQQGRPVMHKAGVFDNFVMRLVWESHPSLWSDTVHILQRSRLEGADRHSRNIPQLWEAVAPLGNKSKSRDNDTNILDTFNAKWWEFLNLTARRERTSIEHHKASAVTSMRRDVVSIFVLSRMTLSIGPEALELANFIASKVRSSVVKEQGSEVEQPSSKNDNSSPAELIELWRELNGLSIQNEDHDQVRGEDRPSRIHGTTVQCNLFLQGASVNLICPYLAEDTIDRTHSQPIIVRDEKVSAGFPNGLQLSYRWRSQRGATGVPSRVEDVSAGPTSPSHSFSLRQSAFVRVPLIVFETSRKTIATMSNLQGRLADSVTYKRKRRIGVDVAEKTHRGSHRTFDVSVASLSVGVPSSDLDTYAELGRVFSIYGLMLRALSLDLEATFRWQQERRNDACDAVFAIPFSVLSKLSPEEIRTICFGRQARYLKSQRYIPRIQESDLIENSFLASEELERNLAMIARESSRPASNRPYSTVDDIVTCSVSLTAGIHEIVVAICEREALSIRKFAGEGQFEILHDAKFGLQEPPVVRIGIESVKVSLRDDVADSGMRTVSSVASYIRFAASYIPMLSYEVISNDPDGSVDEDLPTSYRGSAALKNSASYSSSPVEPVEDIEPTPKRSRYLVRSSTRFMLRRNVQEQFNEQDSKAPRTPRSKILRRSLEDSPRGLTPVHSPVIHKSRSMDEQETTNMRMAGTPRQPRPLDSKNIRESVTESDDAAMLRATEIRSIGTAASNRNRQQLETGNDLKSVLSIYKAPSIEEVSSARGIGKKKGFVVRSVEQNSRGKLLVDNHLSDQNALSSDNGAMAAVRNQRSGNKSFKKRDSRRRQGRATPHETPVQDLFDNPNIGLSKSKMSSSHALTVICSISGVQIAYFRSESRGLFGEEPDETNLTPDLAITVDKLRASAVITPLSLHQSVVVTVDGASLRSGSNSNCALEGSVRSIVSMVSISSNALPTDPKQIIASTRVSDFQLSLQAQDLRSVLAFQEKFKKDMASLASSSLSTRKSLAAMMRATKLENLTRTSAPRIIFSTIAADVSFEKVRASLLGFHPADKEMEISYDVDSIFGSFVAMEDSSIALSVGGLVYGHGLVLSSPSWPKNERFDFPALDARGVQWMHTTGLPSQVKVTAGPLISSTSFQGLRNVLFAVSGLLAFQNKVSVVEENIDEGLNAGVSPVQATESRSSLSPPGTSRAPDHIGTGLNRLFAAWQRTSTVRIEYALRPMSVGLVSGNVMAAFETESISGVIAWNKQVTVGNQLQAVLTLPLFRVTYSRVDQTTHSPDEIRSENSSLLVAVQDVRLDLLKSQVMLTHNFVFRVKVGSISGHLRPWRFMSDAAVWANEQDVVQKFQAVNSDVALRNRSISNISISHGNDTLDERTEHRVLVVGADINSVTIAVPLLDSENSDNHRLRVTATEVRYQMRLGHEFALPSQSNLAQLRSQFIGVLWEDSAFLSANEFEVMFAASSPTEGKKAHFGAIRGSCSTNTWIVCPRKDVVLAFLQAKIAPENQHSTKKASQLSDSRQKSSAESASSVGDRRQLFQSVEFVVLPSRGFIRGLDAMDTFSGKTRTFIEPDSSSSMNQTRSELSIPTFSIAFLRNPKYEYDLLDVDFSGKNDEFPQDILRKTGNIFSELFGAVATSTAETSATDLSGFSNTAKKPSREITRDWSALVRFGKSRYVAREALTGKMNTRLEFYAGNHAGLLASVAANPGHSQDATENSTVLTGVAPLLSLKIKPDLEKAKTQTLELSSVRFLQGYAPSVAPHTCMHLQGVNATMDVLTILLVKEWLKRCQVSTVVRRSDASSEESSLVSPKGGGVWDSTSIIVLGQPARSGREKPVRKSSEVAVRIMLQLSQPDGRVGLLIQRIHFGVAVQKLRNSALGYSTDVDIGIHQIESRANWEYLACNFKLSRLLFRFEGERAMQEENICGFAAIVNQCAFDFKRGDFDALQLKIEGIAGACRVPDCDLAVQTTIVDASISSSTGKTVQRLLQLAARLSREARRQIESLVLSEPRVHDVGIKYNVDDPAAPPLDLLLPRSRGDVSGASRANRSQGASGSRGFTSTGRIIDEPGARLGFSNGTAYLSGDRLAVTMHGYSRFQEAGGAQLKFLAYELDYKQQSGSSYNSRGSDGSSSRVSLTRRQLRVTFDLLDVCYSTGEKNTWSHSILSMPNPMLDFTVQERGNMAIVDFVTKFEKEIIISSSPSHYDNLINMFKLYAESQVQVVNMVEQFDELGDLRLPIRRAEVPSPGPFGGREVEFKRFILAPRLQPLGELTPDLSFLERFGVGKEKIPAGLYDFVMIPIANALGMVTKPLL